MVTQNSIVGQTPEASTFTPKEFLAALAPGQDPLIYTGKDKSKNLNPKPTTLLELGKLNSEGLGGFYLVNQSKNGGKTNSDICAINALFAEFDDGQSVDEVKQKIQELGLPEPSAIIQSKAGPHVYWFLQPGQPTDRFRPAMLKLAAALGSDSQVCTLSRLMRLPGTLHHKGEPFLVECKLLNDQRYTIDAVVGKLPDEQKSKPKKRKTRIEALADEMRTTPEGDRRTMLNSLSATAAQSQSLSKDDAKAALTESARAAGLEGDEIEDVFDEAWDWGKEQLKQRQSEKKATKAAEILDAAARLFPSLQLHVWTKELLLEGKIVTLDHALFQLQLGINCSDNLGCRAIKHLAESNPYDPIMEGIEALPSPPKGTDYISELVDRGLGLKGHERRDYYQTLMRKTLISAMARLYKPGCKVDTMLTLVGKQGCGKSTLVELIGGQGYLDVPSEIAGKDKLQLENESWVNEISESNYTMNKRSVELMKADQSRRADKFRAPYDRGPTLHPRRFIRIGTANRDDFLHDGTGSRRFWIIKTEVEWYDLNFIESIRDGFMAQARDLFLSGESWVLTRTEEQMRERVNEDFAGANPVGERAESAILKIEASSVYDHERKTHIAFTSAEWLEIVSGGTKADNRSAEMKNADALKNRGYERNSIRVGSGKEKVWAKAGWNALRATPTDTREFRDFLNGEVVTSRFYPVERKSDATLEIVDGFNEQ